MPEGTVAQEPRRRAKRTARPMREAPPESVSFKHPGGKTRQVRIGFAWDLFLFAGLFGLPLFLRHLPQWGAAVLGLWVADLALGWIGRGPLWMPAQMTLFLAFLGLQLWLGFTGNALTARACRARGWTPDTPRDPAVRRALEQWGLGAA